MKVYIVLYEDLLDDGIFCDVFASQEAAKKFADAAEAQNEGITFKVEEWEVREE